MDAFQASSVASLRVSRRMELRRSAPLLVGRRLVCCKIRFANVLAGIVMFGKSSRLQGVTGWPQADDPDPFDLKWCGGPPTEMKAPP
jgi:hypothetical protein